MPTKAKSSKPTKAPVAKKTPVRKSPPKATAEMLAKQVQTLSRRLRALENSARVPGPPGEPGPPGPKGEPEDPARLQELERRVKELENRLASPPAVGTA